MNPSVDTVIAYRILKMLLTPFKQTEAYKYGIIDASGVERRKSSKTFAEQQAYTPLHKLVYNLKRIINKTPGGESRMKNIAAALYLAKENYNSEYNETIVEQFYNLVESDKALIEEEVQYLMFNEDMVGVVTTSDGPSLTGTGGLPTNNTTGAAVDEPKIYKKKFKIVRRKTQK